MAKYVNKAEVLNQMQNLSLYGLTLYKRLIIDLPTIDIETCETCTNYGDELSDKWCESRKGYSGKDEFCNRWEERK